MKKKSDSAKANPLAVYIRKRRRARGVIVDSCAHML